MTDRAHGSAGSDTESPDAARPDGAESRPTLNLLTCFGVGIAAALLGLLPWILTGMRLPLQNLWATGTAPEAMPIAFLPLSQYATTVIPGLLVTGAAAAGLAARALRPRLPRRGAMVVALAVLLVDAIAGVQSSIVVADGLERSNAAAFYLTALVIVILVSIAMALVVLLLVARAPVPGATIALSVAALAAGMWLDALIAPAGTVPTQTTMLLLGIARWVPAVLVGLAIGWCGVRSAGRIAAVVVSLVALWIGPAAITAVSAAAGARILLRYPAEMLDYGMGVLTMAATLPELVLPPLIVAVVVGALLMVVRHVVRSRA
jgi:hypothetical protein